MAEGGGEVSAEPEEQSDVAGEEGEKARVVFRAWNSRKVVDNKYDVKFKGSRMDKYFKVTERGSNLTTEIRAGITTFMVASYVMAANPSILHMAGLNIDGVVFATAVSSGVATLIMALFANLPYGLWPGLGMTAYFAETIVGYKGSQQNVKAVMLSIVVEGMISIFLSAIDARRWLMRHFPAWLMKAITVGIGLYLAFLGLRSGIGIDVIRDHPSGFVDMQSLIPGSHVARTWIGIMVFCLMAVLVALKVRGAMIICMVTISSVCWLLKVLNFNAFMYQPMCCLGYPLEYPTPTNSKPETLGYYPKPGGGWLPRVVCKNALEVPGEVEVTDGPQVGGETTKVYTWKGTLVQGNSSSGFTVGALKHNGSLLFKGNPAGQDSSYAGDCSNVCHSMFGVPFNPACLQSPAFGGVGDVSLISTGCWSDLFHQEFAQDKVVVDGYSQGCIGGGGLYPKTFRYPTTIISVPRVGRAGGLISPYPGFWGCEPGSECRAGDIAGGTVFAFDASNLTWDNFGVPMLTFLYMDFLGTMGVLYAAAGLTDLTDDSRPGHFPGSYAAFMADAVGTLLGGLLGTTPVTTYAESIAGVYEGGKTGLTALVIAILNFMSIFFAPLFSSMPTLSTGPSLIMVGVFMMDVARDIEWGNYFKSVPSLVCILLQPVTNQIEYGIIGSVFVWFTMMALSLRIFIYIPRMWSYLPSSLKVWVARQDGDDKFRNDLFKVVAGDLSTDDVVRAVVEEVCGKKVPYKSRYKVDEDGQVRYDNSS
eukprot:CAMPEP_0117477096 /NCGR_PEP_ID=MMETSP0784-20121206/10648_1 /TAXON_ID=39447 /ORGANISM="" /LENGTH=759 /DNA_ID=CAMNT_0005271391 /DNA_START=44 /DNA_END=2323 /DNA_ORIENTATION=-